MTRPEPQRYPGDGCVADISDAGVIRVGEKCQKPWSILSSLKNRQHWRQIRLLKRSNASMSDIGQTGREGCIYTLHEWASAQKLLGNLPAAQELTAEMLANTG